MGLKVGIYSSAGTVTCAKEYPGSLGYEEKDAAVWASWGVWCPEEINIIYSPLR